MMIGCAEMKNLCKKRRKIKKTGRKKKNTILNMLFGKRFLNEISANCKKFTVRLEKQKKLQKHNDKLILEWEKYRSKIIFPCSSYNKSDSEKSYNPNLKYGYEKKFLEKMQRFSDYVDVIINPDIVYYSSKETDHRPMFLLRLNDGTKVLVVLLQTINMALIYNIRRCNELHRFCKENGYGYLIIDDRGNSIYDVKNRVIDDELVSLLNIIIARRGIILWSDIKDLKLTRPVSNLDIAAYVLQNKLYFTMEPYRIMQR